LNKFHLAQINIARAQAPMDSETMKDFANRLDEINALADRCSTRTSLRADEARR